VHINSYLHQVYVSFLQDLLPLASSCIDSVKSFFHPTKHAAKREIEALRLLSACPNVVKHHDVIETSEAVFIVMECFKNGQLFDYLFSKGRLSEDEAHHIFHLVE
jgi:serine/threonine protein kinase